MFQMFFFPFKAKDNKTASSPDILEPPRGCSVSHPEGPPCCRHPLSQSCKCCSFPSARHHCSTLPSGAWTAHGMGFSCHSEPEETQRVPAGFRFLLSQGQFLFSLLKLRVAAVFDCFLYLFCGNCLARLLWLNKLVWFGISCLTAYQAGNKLNITCD